MTINRNFLKVMWVIVITVLQFMRAIISLKKRGATLMLSFSSCEAKKGSRDLDFSDMKKLDTYVGYPQPKEANTKWVHF